MPATPRLILCLGTTPALQRTMRFGRLTLNGVNRAAGVCDYASGKPVNVARVAHGLGQDVRLLLPLGGDRGRAIRTDLDRAGIPVDVVDVEPETRLCITAVAGSPPSATELVEEHQPLPAAVGARLLELLESRLLDTRVLVLSGSVAAGIGERFLRRRHQVNQAGRDRGHSRRRLRAPARSPARAPVDRQDQPPGARAGHARAARYARTACVGARSALLVDSASG